MVTKAFSIEDGNQSSSILTSRKTKYSDIYLLFARKISGDIFKKVDASAVKQSVKNIVRTGTLEKRRGLAGGFASHREKAPF